MLSGIFGSLGVRVLAIPISFALGVLLARSLGVDSFGRYSYLISCISLFMMPIFTGWSNFIIKKITDKKSDTNFISHMVKYTFYINIIFSLLVLGFVCISVDIAIIDACLVFLISLFFCQVVNIGSIIRALGWKVVGQIPDSLIKPFLFLVFTSVMFIFNLSNISFVLLAHFLSLFLSLIFALFLLTRLRGVHSFISENNNVRFSNIVIMALPFLTISVLNSANTNLPAVFLGIISENQGVASYKVAQQMSSLANICLAGVLAWTAPILNNNATGNTEIKSIILKTTGLSLLPTTVIVLIFYFFSEEILTLVYGIDYAVATEPLVILALNEFVLCLFLVCQQLL